MLDAGTLVMPSPIVAVNASGEVGQKGAEKKKGEDAEEAAGSGDGDSPQTIRRTPISLTAPDTTLELSPILSADNFDPAIAAASVERLSAMYRDVAVAQLAMVEELSRLSSSLSPSKAVAGSTTAGSTAAGSRRVLGNGGPAPASRRSNKPTPPPSDRASRKLAFHEGEAQGEEPADGWSTSARNFLPSWAGGSWAVGEPPLSSTNRVDA